MKYDWLISATTSSVEHKATAQKAIHQLTTMVKTHIPEKYFPVISLVNDR